MGTAEQLRRTLLNRDIKPLEMLRKLRRDRAEAEVSIAQEEEFARRKERHYASIARMDASTLLQQWTDSISSSNYDERLRKAPALSQAIYEFKQLKDQLQRREFLEFAATRRESIAIDNALEKVKFAKSAAISHEKIIECSK